MRRRKSRVETPVLQAMPVTGPVPSVIPAEGTEHIPKKHFRRPATHFMVDALMKRD